MKIFASPGQYLQGYDLLSELYLHVKNSGTRFLILGTKSRLTVLGSRLTSSFDEVKDSITIEYFGGESSWNEINRITEIAKKSECDCVIGVGAGKAIDTAKMVAENIKAKLIIVPTAASSDAPTSSVAVIYTDEGIFDSIAELSHNPDKVIVDTKVIVEAGPRLLRAGMGDALATYFEARNCVENYRNNCLNGLSTKTAWELAKLSYKLLLENGIQACLAVEKGLATPAVEDIIETNTLLSGLGFESCGVSAAHAIYNGFTIVPEHESKLHGELVAFGVICQLIMENRSSDEIDEVMRFCMGVSLPTTLAEIGMDEISDEDLTKIAAAAAAPGREIHNEPFPVTVQLVKDSILATDSLGKYYKS